MANVQWVYANGCNWVTLDSLTQRQIENLWAQNSSSWIQCSSFRGAVYIDIDQMLLLCNGMSYSIARRRS